MMKTPQQFLNDCITAYLAYARGCGFAPNALDATPALVKSSITVGSAIFKDANLQKAADDPIAFKRKVIGAIGACVYAGIVFGCKYRKDPKLAADPALVARIVEDGPMDMARDTLKRHLGFEQGSERTFITGLTDKWGEVCSEYLTLPWMQRQGYIAASMIAAFRLGVTMVMDKAKIPDGSEFVFGDEPKAARSRGTRDPTEARSDGMRDHAGDDRSRGTHDPTGGLNGNDSCGNGSDGRAARPAPPTGGGQEANDIKIEIDAKCSKCLCLAQVQSHIPLVSQVRLVNPTHAEIRDLVCRISSAEGFFATKNIPVALVPSDYEAYVGNVDLKCDKQLLSEITEAKEDTVKVEVLKGEDVVASKSYTIWAMAKEVFVWGNDDILFAAYAARDAISIAHLQSHVAEQLEEICGSPAIHSYQGGDPAFIQEHCFNLCRAIYNAIQLQGISYSEPKAADGLGGQKVRLADDVFVEKQATCLDSAVLFAAVMESCGLNAVLFLKNNHAFVGCHLLDYHFSKVVMGSDPKEAGRDLDEIKSAIRTASANTVGRFIAIETTCIGIKRPDGAGGMRDISFDEALIRGREEVDELLTYEEDSTDCFEAAVDVKLARRRGVLPLSGSTKLTVESCPVKPVARYVQVVEETQLKLEELGCDGKNSGKEKLSPRVAHWADRLMQLGALNPLLNRAKSPCLINIECAERDIAAFEDRMSAAGGFYVFADWPTINKRNATVQEREYASHNDGELPPGSRARMIAAEFDKDCLCVADKVGRNGKRRNKLNKRVRRRPQYVSDLTKLEALGLASAEETGTETLYAAIGSLQWEYVDSKGKSETCLAPILLMPIELEISSGFGGCRVRKSSGESDTILNQSLVKLLETENIYFDDFNGGLPTDDSGIDVMRILRSLENRLFGREKFKVVYDLCFGHFTFGNYAKWSDVHDHADMLEKHPLVKHLIERKGIFNDGIPLVTTANINEHLDPTDLYCPKPMDSTQLSAVINSSRGKSFLLDGPPGTGKSHTITNIIAHNLAKGKRILFVAQKETALNVVKERLDKVGLAPFCLQLYAEQSDKAAVLRQFQDSIDVSLNHSPNEWKKCAEALKAYKGPLEEYVKVLHRPLGNGLTPYQCLQAFFQYGRSPYAKYIDPDCYAETADQLEKRRTAIREFANLFAAIKPDFDALQSLPELQNARVSYVYTNDLMECCRSADMAAEKALKTVAELGDVWNIGAIPDVAAISNLVRLLKAMLETGYSLEVVPPQYYRLDDAAIRDQLKADAERSDMCSDLAGKTRAVENRLASFAVDLEKCLVLPCDEMRREVEQWKGRGLLRIVAKNPLKKLQAAVERAGDGRSCGTHDPTGDGRAARPAPPQPSGVAAGPKLETADAALAFLSVVAEYQSLKRAGQDGGLPECGSVQAMSEDARAKNRERLATLEEFVAAIARVEQFLPSELLMQNPVSDVQTVLKNLVSSERLIGKKVNYSAQRAAVEECKMGEFAKLVEDGVIAPERVSAEFDRAFESKMLDRIMRDEQNRAIDGFRVVNHNSSISHYKELLKKYQKAAKEATIAMIAKDYPDLKTGAGLSEDENRMLGEINDYIVKPSNCRSIRQFLIDNAPLVEKTKRCLLMTPSSVSQFLTMDVTPFDMVIFDEASQLETCDAVGVIARGKQVIVTGDPKQMPPYDKIGSAKGDESTEMDSVLDECKARGLPSVKLAWHYRSRHESLISFSNSKYYGDELNTFPSVNESKSVGVQYRFVPDGVFYSPSKGNAPAEGEARQIRGANVVEALRVVDYVLETAKSFEFQSELQNGDEDPVIGVVAFNQTQQDVITRILKGRAPAFLYQKRSDGKRPEASALAGGRDAKKPVAYFVKNIESVQGDEADVIVFSVCYGPYQPRSEIESLKGTLDYKKCFPSGFGTLNTEGGEKRLNVAITRARARMMVFSSIHSDEVSVADEKKLGPLHLKEFLAVAERSGQRMLGDSVAKPSDGLMKIVADTLAENGYEYVAMVGASKCKIDLAVCDKFDPHRFMLGIECDGPMYRDQPLVMDRDVSRTAVLKGAQWEMYRVWSAEWLQGYPDCTDAKRRLLTRLAELTEVSRQRRQNRWRDICRCKDVEAREIEDFSVGAQGKDDLLADVIEDMEDNEEEA